MNWLEEDAAWLLGLVLVYGLVSLAWSAMALLIPYRLPVVPEYQPGFLLTEVSGHVLFGLAAGVFFGKVRLALLCGILAAVIDADHLLSIAVSPVLDRSAHSILFTLAAATVLSLASAKGRKVDSGVFFIVIASVLTHFSFDVFLSNGRFPLFFPLTIQTFSFPQESWPIFEVAAVLVGLIWRLSSHGGRRGVGLAKAR